MTLNKFTIIGITSLVFSIALAHEVSVGTQVKTITVTKTITIKATGTDKEKVVKFVNELMTKRQANCLLWIFEKESNIRTNAKNPDSSARGIGQLLASTYANIGLKHSADPMAQVVAAIAYISRHYGSDGACAAQSFWKQHHYW